MPDAGIHSRFAELATRLIARHGREMHLAIQTTSGPSFNPEVVESLTPIIGVQTKFTSNEIDGDLVRKQDKKILVDSASPISTDMRIRDGSASYSIIAIDEVKPGSESILYKVQCRV